MSHYLRSLILIALIVALPLPVSAQASIGPASNPSGPLAPEAASWYDGLIQYSTITNCFSIIQGLPYLENGAGTYVGFAADPDAAQPAPNQSYYVHVVVAGLGNACSGQRAYIDLALPANSSLAINATDTVLCYYDGTPLSAAECPQTLPASSYNPGAYWIPSSDNAHANLWPIPQGHILEIRVPIKSSTALTNSPLRANVWMLDGNSSPWLHPQQGVYVFSSTPMIIYPSPSTITVTATSAHSQAYLYTFGATGTGYFDLGTTASYGLAHDAVPITLVGNAWLAWDDWGPPPLQPDTLYHWRFTFTTSTNQTYYGTDQTFRTLPDGRVTVGNGATASCTESAFNSALTTAKEILFDCGVLPVTITLSSAHTIASNLTINGGNKVTLDMAHTTRHFTVQAGTALTLTQIALVNGLNVPGTCGGAVNVAGNARLTLNETRFIGNHSTAQGGAVCVNTNGAASIGSTLFMSNTAGTHGGAIGNYGSTSISDSKFTGNTANVNGGGIDTTVALSLINTAFISNTAGFRGGGVNNYMGVMSISNSSFSRNAAGMYGGGVSNDAGPASIGGSTFNDNVAPSGGGLENSDTLNLTNSTISGNRASAGTGGGLYWVAGSIGLLNTTLANNTATTQGGNIYAGGSANASITLKNTLIAAGAPNNCDATLSSQGNNLENTNSCGLAATGDKINVNPQLGPLQDNGGATWTHALLFGSPAIDAGTNSGCPATDQRGVARPIDGNHDGSAVCDIGAVEAPNLTPQTITFNALPNKAMGDLPFTITATASSGLTVTFAAQTPGVCTVSGNTVTLASGGLCTLRASQAGDATYAPAPDVDQSFTVFLTQTINFAPIADHRITDLAFAVTPTATSGLSVTASSLTANVCTVNSNFVTLVATGTCTLRASQSGNASYAPAPDVDQSFTVFLTQTINFAPIADHRITDLAFGVTPTATSGLTVTVTSLTTGVCGVSHNLVTLLTAGLCTLRAAQSGNATYAAAPNVDRSFNVKLVALYLPLVLLR